LQNVALELQDCITYLPVVLVFIAINDIDRAILQEHPQIADSVVSLPFFISAYRKYFITKKEVLGPSLLDDIKH
jgi:hypothetical protein